MSANNATTIKREFSRGQRPDQCNPRCLFPADVEFLREWDAAKRRVKELDDYLKPKILATLDKHGSGTLVLGTHEILLSQSIRETVAWKQVCEAVAPPEVIEKAKPEFTTRFEITSAKVIS
jgi:hypothetical protein